MQETSITTLRSGHSIGCRPASSMWSRRARRERPWIGFSKRTVAALWIQHDLAENAKLKKVPDYYE